MATALLSQHSSNPLEVGSSDIRNTVYVQRYLEAGFARLNRDILGGSLDDLLPKLRDLLESGQKRIVLDNTYPTRVSRYPVIRMAHRFGVPVRCIYLATPLEEAHINVVSRILERYDHLLGPEEMKELGKTDPNLPPPQAMSRWAACFEPVGKYTDWIRSPASYSAVFCRNRTGRRCG